MKNSKLKKIFALAVTSACMVTALPSCGCNHSVGDWTVLSEATCSQTGEQEGICGICLQTVREKIAKDPDNHPYGEWQFDPMPTEESVGKATINCTQCNENKSVDLPALNEQDYETSVTVRPTSFAQGEKAYVLKNKIKDVVITKKIDMDNVSVADAVDVSTMQESKNLIRRSEGTFGTISYNSSKPLTMVYPFLYEFGENYTHIKDSNFNNDRYYGYDENGELYGFIDDRQNNTFYDELKSSTGTSDYLNGFRFYFNYESWLGTYYGVEELLAGLYQTASANHNGDFAEGAEEIEGERVYSFSFGSHSGSTNSDYFSIMKVSFTLHPTEFTVTSLSLRSQIYFNSKPQNQFHWALDGNGNAYVKEKHIEDFAFETVGELTQITKTESALNGEEVPTNPYNKSELVATSFDIAYNGEVITENSNIRLPAGVSTGLVFSVTNILPATAANSKLNNYQLYRREKSIDGQVKDTLLSYSSNEIAYALSGKKFLINSHIAGDITFVLKTDYAEKEFSMHFIAGKPSALYPSIYEYGKTGYSMVHSSQNKATATVYTGQPFYFVASVPDLEKNQASNAYNVTVNSSLGTVGALVETLDVSVRENGVESMKALSCFRANEAGVYTLAMTSAYAPNVTCEIEVTVVSAPEFEEILAGKYAGTLKYPVESEATVEFYAEGETLYAKVTFNGNTEILSCTYQKTAYDPVNPDDKPTSDDEKVYYYLLETAHFSGANEGFAIAINEAYDLVLSHPSGFGDETDSIVLKKAK